MALEGDALQPREDCTAHVTRKHGTRRRQVFRLIVQTEVLTAPSDECQDDMQSFGHLGVVDGHLGEFRVEQALQRGEIERGVVPGQQIGLTRVQCFGQVMELFRVGLYLPFSISLITLAFL